MSSLPKDPATGSPEMSGRSQLVVFSLGEEEYALPIEHVHEIIRYTPPRTVASQDRSVRGVISLRGKILPVYDLAVRLGLSVGAGASGKIVIVETTSATAGVVVDEVAEVLTVTGDQLDVEGARGVRGDGVQAIAKIGDRLVVLLTPDRIVGPQTADDEHPAESGEPAAASPVAPVETIATAA